MIIGFGNLHKKEMKPAITFHTIVSSDIYFRMLGAKPLMQQNVNKLSFKLVVKLSNIVEFN